MTDRKIIVKSWIAAGLVLPPFLLGGIYSHIGTNLIIMGIISFFGILYSIYSLLYKKEQSISFTLIPLILISLFILFQLIPLHPKLLEVLSPKAAFFVGIENSGSHPLALSIPDSWYTLTRVITLIIFVSLISRPLFSDKKKWRGIIINLIIAVSTCIIAISIVFRILQFNTWLYGTLKHPGFLLDPIIINPNHAAGFFGISGILSLLLLTKKEQKKKKIFYGALFFLHSLAVAATLSRGGILAYSLAVIFFLVLSRYSFVRNKKNLILLLLPLLLILSTVFYAGFALLEKEFDVEKEGFFNKIGDFENAIEYSSDFFLTGSGAGSFSKVYTYYQKNPETRFVQLENEPVQFFLEYGLFSLVIFLTLIFITIRQKKKDRRYKGYYAVFFFVILQNTVDFNLHNFATLFPVLVLMLMSTDHIKLTEKKSRLAALILLLLSISVFMISVTPSGHKLVGYEKENDYNRKTYLYPAHYLVPMEKTIQKMNSGSTTEAISASETISAVIDKAPEYYFSYFLAGNLMLRINSYQQALEFFRISLEKCDKNLLPVFKKINHALRQRNLSKQIPGIIPRTHDNLSDLEKFLVKESIFNKALEDFISENRNIFPVGSVEIFIRNKDFITARKIMDDISPANFDKKTNGELMILSGKIKYQEKNYEGAFNKYMHGAEITGYFSHFLIAAYCSLKLGKTEMDRAEKNLKKYSLHSTQNLAAFYLWKHRKALMSGDVSRALKSLEKAAEINPRPNLKKKLANFYYRNGLYSQALLEIKEIMRKYPEYRKDEMKKLLKKIEDIISRKDMDIIKNSLLNKNL